MALRPIRAYHIVSYEVACMLAGTTPWDLDAEMLANVWHSLSDARSRGDYPPSEVIRRLRRRSWHEAMARWMQKLEEPTAGTRTVEAIRPVLSEWVEREHGALSLRLVQILSGHGCFGRYLHRIAKREPSPRCHQCDCAEDTVQHTLEVCPEWSSQRSQLNTKVGADLSLAAIVLAMAASESTWDAVRDFCEEVMGHKEDAERNREDDPSSLPMRRRRTEHRTLAHMRQPP